MNRWIVPRRIQNWIKYGTMKVSLEWKGQFNEILQEHAMACEEVNGRQFEKLILFKTSFTSVCYNKVSYSRCNIKLFLVLMDYYNKTSVCIRNSKLFQNLRKYSEGSIYNKVGSISDSTRSRYVIDKNVASDVQSDLKFHR